VCRRNPSYRPSLRQIAFAARQIARDVECDLIRLKPIAAKYHSCATRTSNRIPHPELRYRVNVYLPKAAHSFHAMRTRTIRRGCTERKHS
jgi:hypothetical protein